MYIETGTKVKISKRIQPEGDGKRYGGLLGVVVECSGGHYKVEIDSGRIPKGMGGMWFTEDELIVIG